MNRTRRLKNKNYLRKTKRNLKRGLKGGEKNDGENLKNDGEKNDGEKKERTGIIDFIQSKIGDVASGTGEYLSEKGLKLIGLKPIDKEEELKDEVIKDDEIVKVADDKVVDNSLSVIADKTSDIVSNVSDVGATVIDNLKEVIGSPQVSENVSAAAEQTADITENLLENINDKFDNPEFKKELSESIDNAADVAEITIKAMDKPIDAAIVKLNDAGTKAASGIGAGAIKVGTDMLGAIPGFGAIIDLGKIINDSSKAVSAVVEAGSEATETASDLFIETNENMKEGLKDLEEKKKESAQLINRTDESVSQFEQKPNTSTILSGGGKSRRYLFKKGKGKKTKKRVRFLFH